MLRQLAVFLLLLLLGTAPARAQGMGQISVHATGLTHPIGVKADAQGRLWVAEQGSGNDDGQIAIVTADGQVHPFLTGLPSVPIEGEFESAQHLQFRDGALWITLGLGSENPTSSLIRADTSGFSPGDTPLTMDDVELIEGIGAFVTAQGFAQTNVYNLAFGPEGNQFLVDASANAILQRDAATGDLSVFASFDDLPNPTPVGPPMIQTVPTSIVFVGPLSGTMLRRG